MTFTDKIKLVNKATGTFHDFLFEADSIESLIATALAFETQAMDSGFAPFASQVPAGPAVPGVHASNPGEYEVALDQAQPGQLAKRFRSAVIEVTPKPNGMANVAFYGDDKIQPVNEFPYVQNTYKMETWAKKFENVVPFTPAHFGVAARYAVVADVEVRYGDKRNTKGNLYRNVTAITPAPGMGPQEVATFEVEAENDTQDVPF